LLIPDPSISTEETGTRHKSAERAAKETGELVICISQRRNIITLYKNSRKYILRDTPIIAARANQALQTLEKYKVVLDSAMNNLSVLEFEDIVTLDDVVFVIQRTEMFMRVAAEIDRYICELGNEGRLVSMQLEELIANREQEVILVIEDYMIPLDNISAEDVQKKIRLFTYDELMDLIAISSVLGYYGGIGCLDLNVFPKGYRMLKKLPKVSELTIRSIVDIFSNFQGILNASIDDLDEVEGIGEVRAKTIKEGLRRVREQLLLDNRQF
jgi:diadenylate cyclase